MSLYTIYLDGKGRPRKVRGTDPVTLRLPIRRRKIPAASPAAALLERRVDTNQYQRAMYLLPATRPGGLVHHTLGFLQRFLP